MTDYQKLRQLGFQYLDSPYFCEKDRLKFSAKRGEHTNLVYAILVDHKLKYIGKTKDFSVRVHTYRNAKYWCNAFRSNKVKTNRLENAVTRGRQVEFYCVYSDEYEYLEVEMINRFNPTWNKYLCC